MSLRKVSRRTILLAVLCLGAGFAAGLVLQTHLSTWALSRRYQQFQRSHLGKPAPEVSTLTSEGRPWSLHSQRGKIVLLSFWATWCGPCVEELPELRELYLKYGGRDDFIMAGVLMDEGRGALAAFRREHQVEWLQLYEPGRGWENSLARAFDVKALPSLWLFDREGNAAAANLTPAQAEAEITRMLQESASRR